jgi:predicted nucleic acid-binding protein
MKASQPLRVYLDSSILISWLKDEERPDNEMDGVRECLDRMQKGEIQAVVSSLIRTEIDIQRYEAGKQAEFWRMLAGRNPLEVSIDMRICDVAGQLRWFYVRKDKEDGCGTLETPDALHLATAIHNEVSEFYVFDHGVEKKGRSLLNLSGEIMGYSLVVRKPPCTTPRLVLKGKNA